MNIFENIDRLIKDACLINESSEKKEAGIDSRFETADQAREAVRKLFSDHYFKDEAKPKDDDEMESLDDDWPTPPKLTRDVELPNPFKEKKSKGTDTSFREDDMEWEDDDIDSISDEDDADDDMTDDSVDDLYDDFDSKDDDGDGEDGEDDEGRGGEEGYGWDDDEDGEDGEGEGRGRGGEEEGYGGDDDGEDGEDGEGKDGKGKGGKGKGKGGYEEKEGYGGADDGKDGEDRGEKSKRGGTESIDGVPGSGTVDTPSSVSDSFDSFKDELKDAIERASKMDGEKNPKTISDIVDKIDDMDSMSGKDASEKMKELRKDIDEKVKSADDIVGGVVGETSDEDLKKELEEHGYTADDARKNSDAKNAETPTTDSKEEEMKKRAMEGFEKRSKGSSSISKSILYNALKNRGFTEGVWENLIEKIVKEKSKRSGREDNKHRTIRYGNKNHLWRGAVLPTYKSEPGLDKKKIYCFVDWSSSVTNVKGLIESFLGKVLYVTEKLDYGDLDVYGFGNRLSLPRTINKEMIETSGLSTVLSETRAYIDKQSLGGAIENFNAVAHEINMIKSKDEESIFFIFGDGIWTLYGNSQPPVRLKEICPEYRDDIYAFIFYKEEYKSDSGTWTYIMKEVAAIVDDIGAGLGADHVILAPLSDIE